MSTRGWRWAYGVTLALAAATITAQWWGHVDDGDAQLYQVVARQMVADGTWTDLRYLPGAHPHFREHLPFGLWPLAAALRATGDERALPVVGLLFTLGTIALVMSTGRRLAGPFAGLGAGVLLAVTESFVAYGGRGKLDPPLLLFATAAVAPLLSAELKAASLAASAVFGAWATLVKGPFGLLPVVAAAAGRTFRERSWRSAALTSAVVAGSAAPLLVFLAYDRWAGDGSWWRGYGVDQLFASATGLRTDGKLSWSYPLTTLGGRFWPGLPLVGFAAFRSLRPLAQPPKTLRMVGISALVVVAGLCVPTRKLWNHSLVAFPLLALFAAVAVAPALERWLSTARRQRRALVALAAAALVAWSAALLGAGRAWPARPTVACGELAPVFKRLGPGAPVAIASQPVDWPLLAALAAERRLVPWPIDDAAKPLPDGAALLLWRLDAPPPAGWRELAWARGWTVYAPAR